MTKQKTITIVVIGSLRVNIGNKKNAQENDDKMLNDDGDIDNKKNK